MRQVIAAVVAGGLMVGVCWAEEKPALKDEAERISYSVGYQMGSDFKRQEIEITLETFLRGIQDALGGAEPAIPSDQMRQILAELKKRVVAAQREQHQKEARENLEKGKTFLAENAKKEGVTTLPSGLQYRVVREGAGASPKATDSVTAHYRGTLIDGTEFDSSYGRGQPVTFRLNRVIKGWTKGLKLIKPGAKYELFVPPGLAYGERGAGGKIGPNSALVFEVELLSIEAAPPRPPGPPKKN